MESLDSECPICFDVKPLKQYPCNHNICEECHKLMKKNGYYNCQICNEIVASEPITCSRIFKNKYCKIFMTVVSTVVTLSVLTSFTVILVVFYIQGAD